jgi:hypothetical protein
VLLEFKLRIHTCLKRSNVSSSYEKLKMITHNMSSGKQEIYEICNNKTWRKIRPRHEGKENFTRRQAEHNYLSTDRSLFHTTSARQSLCSKRRISVHVSRRAFILCRVIMLAAAFENSTNVFHSVNQLRLLSDRILVQVSKENKLPY